MKISVKAQFEMGLTEVPEKLAKELQKKLEQINAKFKDKDMYFEMKVEEDDEVET